MDVTPQKIAQDPSSKPKKSIDSHVLYDHHQLTLQDLQLIVPESFLGAVWIPIISYLFLLCSVSGKHSAFTFIMWYKVSSLNKFKLKVNYKEKHGINNSSSDIWLEQKLKLK